MGIFSRSKKQPATTLPPKESTTPSTPQPPTYFQHESPERIGTSQGQVYGVMSSTGWPSTPPPPYPPSPYQPCQQVFVSNYFLSPPQPLQPQSTGKKSKNKLQSTSMIHLPALGPDMPSCIPGAQMFNDEIPHWHRQGTQYLNQGAALYDLISSKFNSVVTSIDGERFSGDERDLWVSQPTSPQFNELQVVRAKKEGTKKAKSTSKGDAGFPIAANIAPANYFSKINLYANSRLPPDLQPVKLYIPTFPLLCVAAQYSERVYNRPSGKERETHVDADWRTGTKSMVIKSVPMDDMNVIVFAIRGSQTFLDWAVNLNSAPATPDGFLDDAGNFCHAGFLSVARKMISPVAARLRSLLTEDPNRSASSLLITGHSAGGAVAALLYSHMLSSSPETESELNILAGYFKRIHCITFGAPPVSLLPLAKPDRIELRKSLFLSFINEGDPVARADKPYVRSLLDLYSSPAPSASKVDTTSLASKLRPPTGGCKAASSSTINLHKTRPHGPPQSKSADSVPKVGPTWPVPPSTLSNAGRLILLRSVPRNNGKKKKGAFDVDSRMDDGVQARIVTDEQLRGVIFGDPVCHMMKLYARRIEVLATNAVVGRG